MNQKGKRMLAAAAGLAVCAVFAALTVPQFLKEKPVNLPAETTQSVSSARKEPSVQATPAPIQLPAASPPPVTAEKTELPVTEPPALSEPAPQEQTLQPPSEKPAVTVPSQTASPVPQTSPDEPETPAAQTETQSTKALTTGQTSPPSTEAQPGDTNRNGDVYVPGFGWVEFQGENSQIIDSEMFENGNKIGIM